jgi:glycosyltransferase involved in cell wall biosynthesis
MNILFLTPYPNGEAPSQRFRFEQYLTLLEQKGINFQQAPFLSIYFWKIWYSDGNTLKKVVGILIGLLKRVMILFQLSKYDYVFVHREVAPVGPPIFEWLIAKLLRKKIIYDFDDAIWLEDPDEKGSFLGKIKWKSKVASICKWSYKVSCGNAYLASFAEQYNKNTLINPTTIDTENLHNPGLFQKIKNDKITIGWTGTHSTLHYLKEILPALRQLEEKFEFTLLIIANRPPSFKLDSLVFNSWKSESEISDLMKIDVGIMPLTNDKWSNGKCGFKALQYMALNIPTCAASVGVNTDIIQSGINGYLCSTNEDWIDKLESLLENSHERKKIGNLSRETIVNRYSVKSNEGLFLGLFNQ